MSLTMTKKNFDLPGYSVMETASGPILRSTQPLPPCPACKSKHVVGHASMPLNVMDIPHGEPVTIAIDRRRGRCVDCKKTFSEALPHIAPDRAMTKRLVAWILRESLKRSFVSIAAEVGVTEGSVRAVFKTYFESLDAEAQAKLLRDRQSSKSKVGKKTAAKAKGTKESDPLKDVLALERTLGPAFNSCNSQGRRSS